MNNSPDEQVDIIDIDNRVVGKAPKVEAHKKGLLHRIVIGELVNSRGEFCFVKQAADRQDAGRFVSPVGGHVSAGERIEDALVRESREEIGIAPTKIRFIGSTIYHRQVIGRDENHLFLVYEIHSDQTPTLNHESVEFRWFSIAEIQQTLRDNPDTFGAAWHHLYSTLYPTIYQI